MERKTIRRDEIKGTAAGIEEKVYATLQRKYIEVRITKTAGGMERRLERDDTESQTRHWRNNISKRKKNENNGKKVRVKVREGCSCGNEVRTLKSGEMK